MSQPPCRPTPLQRKWPMTRLRAHRLSAPRVTSCVAARNETMLACRFAVLCLVAFVCSAAYGAAAKTIRLAIQKTGTVTWELDVLRAHGLDKQGGFTLSTLELG